MMRAAACSLCGVPGIEFRSAGLGSRHFYPVSQLTGWNFPFLLGTCD